jgi:diguanylate cyclase (GGDEF)-like protein
MRWVGQWWRQSDHFDWISGYLVARKMTAFTRTLMTAVAASFGLIPLVLLFSPAGPVGHVGTALACLSGIGGMACALLWVMRWPSRTESIAFVVISIVSIALACLAQPDPRMGLLACTAFAAMAGYIALFHTAPYMLFNFFVAGTIGFVEAFRLARATDVILAATTYWLMLMLNLAVPFGIQTIVHTLGIDLLRSDRDPLTGLLNRRAFYDRTIGMLEHAREGELTIAMVDLDRFKSLNDTHGHAAGDKALVVVSRSLRENCHASAVIGRAGGEEFLIACLDGASDPSALGRQLCVALASLPQRLTASVGTTSVELLSLADLPVRDVVEQLINSADAAMYEAKREGGNKACHRTTPWGPLRQSGQRS